MKNSVAWQSDIKRGVKKMLSVAVTAEMEVACI